LILISEFDLATAISFGQAKRLADCMFDPIFLQSKPFHLSHAQERALPILNNVPK
jgi:hypothetical protein